MKKKLLTSAAIASFLTAAGVVIPQTDIFAADTPNPSTLENTPHPSTVPSEQPSTEPKPSAVGGGGNLLEVKDKKKVDSFADYWIEDINLDKNNILTIKTKDNARVANVHYIDEENLPEQSDFPGAHLLQPTQSNGNVYRFDANEMVSGENANKKFILNEIMVFGPKGKEYDSNYVVRKWLDANGKLESAEAYGGGLYLDYKDLHKYVDKTRVVGSKATVEKDPKLPEVGDKDYVVYTDKSQVALNGTIKTTVKYKPRVKKYSDVLNTKYVGKTEDGKPAFENNFGKLKAPFGFDDGKNQDDKNLNLVSWHSMDKEGNDVFYLALKGVPVGHYHITQLFGLDLAKGNFDNADFTVVQGKSVYRADKVEQPKVEQPKVEQPKVEEPKAEKPKVDEPKIIKPEEPTFPKVELPEAPKNKILEQQVGNRRISVHFDSTKIPATYFSAEEVKDKDELAELTKELKAINPKYKLDSVYDLKLTDSLGNTIDSVGSKRTVTLTNARGKSVVYYVYRDENNKLQLEKLPTYNEGNGSIVKFDAKHFSKYALVEQQQPEGPRAPQPAKPEGDKNTGSNWNPFAQGQKAKEGSSEVKSEAGEVATKSVSNRKEGKALPNTGLQTTSYGFLVAIVGLFATIGLRRKNK